MRSDSPGAITGRVSSGQGRGCAFTLLDWVREQCVTTAGIDPFPGTLNLRVAAGDRAGLLAGGAPARRSIAPPPQSDSCRAICVPIRVAGVVPAAIIVPDVVGYPHDHVEIIAAVSLREHLGLRDGDCVEIEPAVVPRPGAVIFDVDGTLVDSVGGMWRAASGAAALFGLQVPEKVVHQALNEGVSLWEAIVPGGVAADPGLAWQLQAETRRRWPQVLAEHVRVFDGLDVTLRRLQQAGIRLAIVTGSRGESFQPLRRAGLMEFFEPVVTALDVTRPKPDPEGLFRCLEGLGCEPEDAIYVGDTRQDIEAGRAAHMRTVGVLTGAGTAAGLSVAGASRLVSDHRQLPDLIFGEPPAV